MRLVFTENVHGLDLPTGHVFPVGKYDRIHAELARRHAHLMMLGAPASAEDLALVHAPAYVDAVHAGTISPGAARLLGFPWSPALALRARRSVGGTLAALAWAVQHGAAGHIAGGTHHAFRDHGAGFCVFNDIAVAIVAARRDHGIRRAAVVDLDVHQGNGTARIFEHDPHVFTLSMHCARNYPFKKERSSLDVALAEDASDAAFLDALGHALERVAAHGPDIVFYQAGVDMLAGDRLGRMGLSHGALAERDARVIALAKRLDVPLVVTLGGGYGRNIETSVRAHVAVYDRLVDAYS